MLEVLWLLDYLRLAQSLPVLQAVWNRHVHIVHIPMIVPVANVLHAWRWNQDLLLIQVQLASECAVVVSSSFEATFFVGAVRARMLLRVAVEADVGVLLQLAAVTRPQLLPISCIWFVELAQVLDLVHMINSLHQVAVSVKVGVLAQVIVLEIRLLVSNS